MATEPMMVQGYIANQTGALTRVCLGFVPDYIRLINVTNSPPSEHVWFKSLGDGYCIQETGGTVSVVSSGGFSAYRGSADTLVHATNYPCVDKDGTALPDGATPSDGFTMGTNALLNTLNEDVHFVAFRGVPAVTAGGTYEVYTGATPSAYNYTDEDP